MARIALLSLFFDRSKLIAALFGVVFSATLAISQVGLYEGFLRTTSALVTRAGGDLWVMGRGIAVIDNGRVLSPGSRVAAAAHPCVERTRGMIVGFAPAETPAGKMEGVEVVGVDAASDVLLPWSLARGLPSDIHGPMRVSIDRLDLRKLHLGGLGSQLTIRGHTVKVCAVTDGIRSFTLAPYVFSNLGTARKIAGLEPGQAHYWILDLRSPSCIEDVKSRIERDSNLQAWTSQEFAKNSQQYWVGGSGAGAMLGFGAILGLLVGAVIVTQTLYSLTRDRLPELATLKALGATRLELASFVIWQAMFLALLGGGGAFALVALLTHGAASAGMLLVLSAEVARFGVVAVFSMCLGASTLSLRTIFKLSPAEVFRL
jgi:putative ABC transport system permease protein